VDPAGDVRPIQARARMPDGRWILLRACVTTGGADDVGFDLPARAAAAAIRPTVVAPSGRQGNGIDDDAWAPILEVGAGIAVPLLGAFRAAGVPAYAASTQPALSRMAAPAYRIWVGASAYGRAEESLITVMPSLTGQPSGRAGDA